MCQISGMAIIMVNIVNKSYCLNTDTGIDSLVERFPLFYGDLTGFLSNPRSVKFRYVQCLFHVAVSN